MPSVFDLLDAEWRRLGTDRRAARRLTAVVALAPGATTLADLEHHVRAAGPEDADRVLLGLVTRVVDDGDDLAGRVLLQLLLPGTRNLARRWWALGDPDERAAAAVAAVYRRIRTYPLARRPGRVAANVLLDAARELRQSVPRVVATPSDRPLAAAAGRPTGSADELAEVLADAVSAGVVSAQDARLIADTRIAGRRITDLAAAERLSTRTLWDRRQRAERRMTTAYAPAV